MNEIDGYIYMVTNDNIKNKFGSNSYKLGRMKYPNNVDMTKKVFDLYKRYDVELGRSEYYRGSNCRIKYLQEVSDNCLAEGILFKLMKDLGFKRFHNSSDPEHHHTTNSCLIEVFEIPPERMGEVKLLFIFIGSFLNTYKTNSTWKLMTEKTANNIVKNARSIC